MGYIKGFAVTMVSLLVLLGGCTASGVGMRDRQAAITSTTSTVFILNGADGPGPWYNSLVDGLREGGAADDVETVNWGAPWLFFTNLLSIPVHDAAEKDLLAHVQAAKARSPEGRITLVGHSAGCGVILGMLKRMPEGQSVDTVMLLAPAVSKGYDLSASLSHVSGKMHVFYSERDQGFLKFSTAVTSTYDHVFSSSAGFKGFDNLSELSEGLLGHLQQHAYDPAWGKLGHHGGHFGYRSTQFVSQILAPLANGTPGREVTAKQGVPMVVVQ